MPYSPAHRHTRPEGLFADPCPRRGQQEAKYNVVDAEGVSYAIARFELDAEAISEEARTAILRFAQREIAADRARRLTQPTLYLMPD